MKKTIVIFFLLFNIFILAGCGNNNKNLESNNTANYTANKTGSTIPNENTTQQINNAGSTPSNEANEPETIASEFSTPIKTTSKNRAKNIQITCSKLNEMTVNPGEEFSFCDRTGVSKESEGYEKADVIVGEKIIKALGGGNCQVSTTLYNAVLAVPELSVTERHPHGKKINYVPEGKDAAIAHGSKDLKFKNNSDKTLKIYASSDEKTVVVKLAFLK